MTSQPQSVSSQTLYRQHHTHSFYDITLAISVASFALYKTPHPHFWISNHHFENITPTILDIVSTVSFITPTLSMISQPLYVWYHILYIWEILSTILMTSYPTPYSAYVCHHLHYRRCHIHSVTTSHNLYDFTSTSGMTSHPLYQTLHQLYLFHHNLSTAITPTFVSHHIHYMCDIICTIHNIISTAYVITLLYLWQCSLDI